MRRWDGLRNLSRRRDIATRSGACIWNYSLVTPPGSLHREPPAMSGCHRHPASRRHPRIHFFLSSTILPPEWSDWDSSPIRWDKPGLSVLRIILRYFWHTVEWASAYGTKARSGHIQLPGVGGAELLEPGIQVPSPTRFQSSCGPQVRVNGKRQRQSQTRHLSKRIL